MALTTGLISYWKLDEVSGARADSVGTNTLTDNNTVASGTGIISNAANFIAANTESLSIADNASLRVATSFTFSGWVNPNNVVGNKTILGRDDGATREYGVIVATANLQVRIWNAASSQQNLTSTATFTAATWAFFVIWYDSVADKINIQINNGAVDVSGAAIGGLQASGVVQFAMGTSAGALLMDGLVDEVGFWKRVLTAPERTSLYNAGAGLSYPFGEGGAGKSSFRTAIRIGL